MKVALGLLVAVTLLTPVATSRVSRLIREWPVDGSDGWRAALVCGEDTVFADGYSAAAFRELRVGMTRARAVALLGPPLITNRYEDENLELARWSYSPGDHDFRRRDVVFENDRIVAIRTEFYLD